MSFINANCNNLDSGISMASALTNTLLANGEAACELALMLPETDIVLELQDVLLYNLNLMTDIVDGNLIDTIAMYDHYQKCKILIKFATDIKRNK